MEIIDMRIQPIFYESICRDEKELEFRMNSFGVFKQSPYPYEEILTEMDYAGVSRSALLPLDLTTTEGGWIVNNEEIAQIVKDVPERFIGFASVDPRRPNAAAVLEDAFVRLQLRGLNLAPQKQYFYPDEEFLYPLYECCIRHNRPVIFNAGLSWEPGAVTEYGLPLKFERVAIRFPQLRMCLSHFAWPFVREMVMLMIKYPNVYTDTSVLYLDSPEESMQRLFEVDMGPLWMDRSLHRQVMFASNGPRFRQFKLIRGLEKLKMRDYAREGLYCRNAMRFLGEITD